MNIFSNANVQRLSRVLQTDGDSSKVKSPQIAGKTTPGDSVNLSQEAKILSGIKQRLNESPDIRYEKIAKLKEAVSNGTYFLSSVEIAEAMMREGKLP